MGSERGFSDVYDRLRRLSDLGDQLVAVGRTVDFEIFRADCDAALGYRAGPQGGRPPFDPVMMFKVLVIQAANSFSDERAEFLINDRLSFMRLLGPGLSGRVPDARTIWLFREKLTLAGAIKGLIERLEAALREAGFIAMSGQIVDASLVAAPRQRNTDDEKRAIKEGRVPEDWKARPGKLRQKDRDARWTIKFSKAKEQPDGTRPPVDIRRRHRITVCGDKHVKTRVYATAPLHLNARLQVARNTSNRRLVIDGRAMRHPGYVVSRRSGLRMRRDRERSSRKLTSPRLDQESRPAAARRPSWQRESRLAVHTGNRGLQPDPLAQAAGRMTAATNRSRVGSINRTETLQHQRRTSPEQRVSSSLTSCEAC